MRDRKEVGGRNEEGRGRRGQAGSFSDSILWYTAVCHKPDWLFPSQ